MLPEFLIANYPIPFYLGGTALLIVVVVGMDTITQIQTRLMSVQYDSLIKKTKLICILIYFIFLKSLCSYEIIRDPIFENYFSEIEGTKNNLILGGVTRDCVIEIASKNNLKVIEKEFDIDDIKKCNEAFLTSTTLGVVPVIKIEDIIINKKEIGLITKTLMKKLEDYLNKQVYE